MEPVIAQLTITLFAELFFSAIFHSVDNGRVDLHAARDREQLYMKPVGEIAVDALRRKQHRHDGDRAERDEIGGAEIGKRLAQREENDRSQNRPFDPADAADDGYEDDIGGPVVHREERVGRNAQLGEADQRAQHRRARRRGDVEQPFGARDVDAAALGRDLIVTDRLQGEAPARARDEENSGQDQQPDSERAFIDHVFADFPGRADRLDDRYRQADARTAAEQRHLRRDEAKHFGDDPGADRKIGAAQPKHQHRNRQREKPRGEAGERNGEQGRHAEQNAAGEQQIGAHADIGLLPHRYESAITRQQVPQARQPDIYEHLARDADDVAIQPERRRRQADDDDRSDNGGDPALRSRSGYLERCGRAHPSTR